MRVLKMCFELRIDWARSLKDKRGALKSLVAKLQNKFHVSAAEIDFNDDHKMIGLGVAAICANAALADSLAGRIADFVEQNCDAQLIKLEKSYE